MMKVKEFMEMLGGKMRWKEVTKQEMLDWVENYPRKLVFDANRICEPPLVAWYDFSLAPENDPVRLLKCRVAKFYGESYGQPQHGYSIRNDLGEEK